MHGSKGAKMTAKEIIKAVREGRKISLSGAFWREFQKECVVRVGDCSDIKATPNIQTGMIDLEK